MFDPPGEEFDCLIGHLQNRFVQDRINKALTKKLRASELLLRLKALRDQRRELSRLIGMEVLEMRENGKDAEPEFLGIIWLLYDWAFGKVQRQSAKHSTIPSALFPSCDKDGEFNFDNVAQHFGAIAIHPNDDFSSNLLKITFQSKVPDVDHSLAKLNRRWWEHEKPGATKQKTDVDVFQEFVSQELKYRQSAFLANTKAEVPMVLVWAEDNRQDDPKITQGVRRSVGPATQEHH